jgi:hypothetical protein
MVNKYKIIIEWKQSITIYQSIAAAFFNIAYFNHS